MLVSLPDGLVPALPGLVLLKPLLNMAVPRLRRILSTNLKWLSRGFSNQKRVSDSGKDFDGCIACENGILVLALRLCRAEVIENAEFGKSFFDANHEVWRRRRTHLYFDLTFVAHHLRPQD